MFSIQAAARSKQVNWEILISFDLTPVCFVVSAMFTFFTSPFPVDLLIYSLLLTSQILLPCDTLSRISLLPDKTVKLWKISERDKRPEGYNLKDEEGRIRDPTTITSLRVSRAHLKKDLFAMPLVCLDTFVQPFSWKDNFLQSLALTHLLRGFVSKYAYIHTI